MMGVGRKLFCVFMVAMCFIPAPLARVEARVTEGQFAVKLAERLGLAKCPTEAEALDRLTGAGITPRNGWHPTEPATKELIVRTQVPIYSMLFRLSRTLKILSPPTLSLQVLEPPYGPQTIIFSEAEVREGEATEGFFAVKFAEKLSLAKEPSEKEAVTLLSKIGVIPDGGWRPEAKATDLFMARVQVAMIQILKEVASQLKIHLPATVNIRVVLGE